MEPSLQHALDTLLDGRRLLFAARHGSTLYGTQTPDSDTDIRAVFIPSVAEILTGKIRFSLDNNPQKLKLGLGDIDITAFSLVQFLHLLGKFDVNAVEMLFASEPGNPALLYADQDAMAQLRAMAPALIGMAGSSPIGHARAVMGALAPDQDTYIDAFQTAMDALVQARADAGTDTHRLYQCPGLLGALRALPRAVYQAQNHAERTVIPEADIPAEVLAEGRWAQHTLFVNIVDRLVPTTMTLHEAIAVLAKPLARMRGQQVSRRARLEGNPVSPKDIYHAIRILTQFVELQQTGRLVFPRPNADVLLGIRHGQITGPDLQAIINAAFHHAQEALDGPQPFPDNADAEQCDRLIIAFHRDAIRQALDGGTL